MVDKSTFQSVCSDRLHENWNIWVPSFCPHIGHDIYSQQRHMVSAVFPAEINPWVENKTTGSSLGDLRDKCIQVDETTTGG